MNEAKRNIDQPASDLGLEGFEKLYDEPMAADHQSLDTESGDISSSPNNSQIEKLLERFGEVLTLSVDQRIENARMATQLIENQKQLIATQQILIRLMEKSIELTKHISEIEEKLPTVFALPRTVESIRDRLVRLEGIEVD
jgi:hypothetical protein